jgi:hypothetical protein
VSGGTNQKQPNDKSKGDTEAPPKKKKTGGLKLQSLAHALPKNL